MKIHFFFKYDVFEKYEYVFVEYDWSKGKYTHIWCSFKSQWDFSVLIFARFSAQLCRKSCTNQHAQCKCKSCLKPNPWCSVTKFDCHYSDKNVVNYDVSSSSEDESSRTRKTSQQNAAAKSQTAATSKSKLSRPTRNRKAKSENVETKKSKSENVETKKSKSRVKSLQTADSPVARKSSEGTFPLCHIC